jgi:hypothetical protein
MVDQNQGSRLRRLKNWAGLKVASVGQNENRRPCTERLGAYTAVPFLRSAVAEDVLLISYRLSNSGECKGREDQHDRDER